MQSLIDATAGHIEDEIAAGRIMPLDARQTARALSLMTDALSARRARANANGDARKVVETLATIWTRTLYGTNSPQPAPPCPHPPPPPPPPG